MEDADTDRESSSEQEMDSPTARAVQSVHSRGLSLRLSSEDLSFLVALHLRCQYGALSSLGGDELEEVFVQVGQIAELEGKRSASRAIARLREQGMLSRIDGLGVVRAPKYSLSRLAMGIVEYYLEEEILTRESLQVLTQSLALNLREIRNAADRASSEDEWSEKVTTPLRVCVAELIRGIERRQRGLDQQQEAFQVRLRGMLDADWFGAMESCQGLMEESAQTLRELAELLLGDSPSLIALLQDILEAANLAGNLAAASLAHRLVENLDRVVAWGSSRQQSWSEYFQFVHNYLRDVVRLDPSRALTQALREQLAGDKGKGFALAIADDAPICVLREFTIPEEKEAVSRPKEKREKKPQPVKASDPRAELDEEVRQKLEAGARSLREVTTSIVSELKEGQRYLQAGRIAESVAEQAKPRALRKRSWVSVSGRLHIEDWPLAGEDV